MPAELFDTFESHLQEPWLELGERPVHPSSGLMMGMQAQMMAEVGSAMLNRTRGTASKNGSVEVIPSGRLTILITDIAPVLERVSMSLSSCGVMNSHLQNADRETGNEPSLLHRREFKTTHKREWKNEDDDVGGKMHSRIHITPYQESALVRAGGILWIQEFLGHEYSRKKHRCHDNRGCSQHYVAE